MGPAGHGAVSLHQAILAGEPIKVFNYGNMERDFTYIDDIIEGCAA
jgi:UDP-glucuronate 4-epimerase